MFAAAKGSRAADAGPLPHSNEDSDAIDPPTPAGVDGVAAQLAMCGASLLVNRGHVNLHRTPTPENLHSVHQPLYLSH